MNTYFLCIDRWLHCYSFDRPMACLKSFLCHPLDVTVGLLRILPLHCSILHILARYEEATIYCVSIHPSCNAKVTPQLQNFYTKFPINASVLVWESRIDIKIYQLHPTPLMFWVLSSKSRDTLHVLLHTTKFQLFRFLSRLPVSYKRTQK